MDGRGVGGRRLAPRRDGVRPARGPRGTGVAGVAAGRLIRRGGRRQQAAEEVAEGTAEQVAQPALLPAALLSPPCCCPPCWPDIPPRTLRSRSPSPPDCPPAAAPPPSRFARYAMTIGARIGRSLPIRSEVVEAPPVVPNCWTTWPRWSPNTWPTIWSPSFSSTSSRFTPPSTRSLSCWRTAEAKEAAPPGSAVLAWMPPSRAGSACRVASSAVPSSTPRRAARSASGMRDRMSSTGVVMGSNGSRNSTPRPGDAAAGPTGPH